MSRILSLPALRNVRKSDSMPSQVQQLTLSALDSLDSHPSRRQVEMVFAFPHAPTPHPLMPSFAWQNAISAETVIPKHPSPPREPLGFSAQGPTGAPSEGGRINSGRTLSNGPVSQPTRAAGSLAICWLTTDCRRVRRFGMKIQMSRIGLVPNSRLFGVFVKLRLRLCLVLARGVIFTAVDVGASAGASVVK